MISILRLPGFIGMTLLFFGTSSLALAQDTNASPSAEKNKRRFSLRIGPQYSIYRLATAKTGQRFSESWTQVGLDWGTISAPKAGLHFQTNSTFLIGRSGSNRVYLLPLQAGVMQGWKTGSGSLYLGMTAGPCGVNLRADPEGIKAGWRVAPSASWTAGANLSRRAFLEVQYYRINPVRGFDFSGSNLTMGFRF